MPKSILQKLAVTALGITISFGVMEASLEHPAVAVSSNQSMATGNPHQLGTNLGGVRDWSPEIPFLDIFKTSRTWITNNDNTWDTGEESKLNLDSNGWVKSLPKPGDTSAQYKYVITPINDIAVPPGVSQPYTGGKYIVTYDGEGKIEYSGDATLDQADSTPGRDVINVNPVNGIFLKITQTDPSGTGNYIRNIHVVPAAYENTYQTQVFNPDFLNKVKGFAAFRFMDWMLTNNSTQGDWSQRPTPTSSTYASQGVPVEIMVALANSANVAPWFNMPINATDEYVTNFAQIVKANLNPNLNVYVEYSNEVWNGSFGQNQVAQQQGQKIGGDWMDWYSQRSDQIGHIWDNVFGQDKNRVVMVLSGQSANSWIADQEMQRVEKYDPNPAINAIAIAPYFGFVGTPDNQAELDSWTNDPDGGLNKLFTQMSQGGVLQNGGSPNGELAAALDQVAQHVSVTQKYGLPLVAYEGGQGLVSILGVENDQAITNLFITANRDPRMGQLYQQYLNGWNQLGGGLFMNFTDIDTPTKWGSWGALEHVNQASSPKWDALMNYLDSNNASVPSTNNNTQGNSTSPTVDGTTSTGNGSSSVTDNNGPQGQGSAPVPNGGQDPSTGSNSGSPSQATLAAPVLNGTGTTFPQELYIGVNTADGSVPAFPYPTDTWFGYFNSINSNQIAYAPSDSGQGITSFVTNSVPSGTPTVPAPLGFGASDVGLPDSNIAAYNSTLGATGYGPAVQIPAVTSAVSVAYNSSGQPGGTINVTTPQMCALFNGTGTAPFNGPITIVHRLEGSGTTSIFSNYLNTVCNQPGNGGWNRGAGQASLNEGAGCAVPPAPGTVCWPANSVAQQGNPAVATAIRGNQGYVGYLENATRVNFGLPAASLQNSSGNFEQPTAAEVGAAFANATLSSSNPANACRIFVTPDTTAPTAYPIVSATYLMFYGNYRPTQLKGHFGADGGSKVFNTALNLISAITNDPNFDTIAQNRGYAPLPAAVKNAINSAINAQGCTTLQGNPNPL